MHRPGRLNWMPWDLFGTQREGEEGVDWATHLAKILLSYDKIAHTFIAVNKSPKNDQMLHL